MNYSLYEIDRASIIPVSRQISELILKNIEAGELSSGDKLPTERELSQRLGVARGTVKAAYKRLERQGAVIARQGSGSFIAKDESLAEKLRLQKAAARLEEAAAELLQAGVPASGIRLLLDKSISSKAFAEVAVISGAPELLGPFKAQLSSIPGVAASVFLLDSVTVSSDAEGLFSGFDVIVVPSPVYGAAAEKLAGLSDKIIEAAFGPSPETVTALAALSRSEKIGVICRSSAYLSAVKDTLSAFGFSRENISFFFEGCYDGCALLEDMDVIIACPGAEILRFSAPAGKLLEFNCVMERGSVIYIENKVSGILSASVKKG